MTASKLMPSSKESRYLLVFAFFYILPLLLANVYYQDDILEVQVEKAGREMDVH